VTEIARPVRSPRFVAHAREQPVALCVGQRGRGEHVEARFHAGGGDVGVLAPGAGGAACAHCHLREGDRQVAEDRQPSTRLSVGFGQRGRVMGSIDGAGFKSPSPWGASEVSGREDVSTSDPDLVLREAVHNLSALAARPMDAV